MYPANVGAGSDRSHALRGHASRDAPRHLARGATQSVWGGIPTQSVGTIIVSGCGIWLGLRPPPEQTESASVNVTGAAAARPTLIYSSPPGSL
ncbi:hypothetical protein METHPM2_150051 [Pseudomonas sp. PM2]